MGRYEFAGDEYFSVSDGYYRLAGALFWEKAFFKRFFAMQFKRTCIPDGPKIGSVSISPRGDLRMPTDASSKMFLEELNEIEKNLTE